MVKLPLFFLIFWSQFGSHLVIFHGQFGSLGAEQKRFGLLEIFQFKTELGLVDQNLGHALWIVALGHPLSVGPVLVVDVPEARTHTKTHDYKTVKTEAKLRH